MKRVSIFDIVEPQVPQMNRVSIFDIVEPQVPQMKRVSIFDIVEPKAAANSRISASIAGDGDNGGGGDFGFAFNDPNFSDRVLIIEMADYVRDVKEEGEGCESLADWVGKKRRREEIKNDNSATELTLYCEENCNQHNAQELGSSENEDDEAGLLIAESHSVDETLQRKDSLSMTMDCSTVVRVETIHVSSPILAARSPFFYKLFSNGMRETEQRCVTMRIYAFEEAALMDLLRFMYSATLTANTAPAILDVMMAADKYKVASCMRYCSRALCGLPMTPDSALLYLELPSHILMTEAVKPLIDAAKEFLASRYKDITKFQDEVSNLPLVAIEAIFASDGLQVASEDAVYDFILKWARNHYPDIEERRKVLTKHMARLIRFPLMTCRKLKKVLACNDFEHDVATKLVVDALLFKSEPAHRQRIMAAEASQKQRSWTMDPTSTSRSFVERAYKYRPVKVVELELPRQQCVVYLDLKRTECEKLFPLGRLYSQAFHLSGQGFFLSAHCNIDPHGQFICFGLFLGMQEKGAVSFSVDYEFAARSKPAEEYQSKYRGSYTFTGGKAVGYRNLFGLPWRSFVADDSPYFINDILHLRADLTIKR